MRHLIEKMRGDNVWDKAEAIRMLGKLGQHKYAFEIALHLFSEHAIIQEAALHSIRRLRFYPALPALRSLRVRMSDAWLVNHTIDVLEKSGTGGF